MRRGNFIWGIIIIVAGVLLLLDSLGILRGVSAWGLIWPVALILLGLWFLLGPRLWGKRNLETRNLTIPLENARAAEVEINHGAGRLSVSALATPGQLVAGAFGGGVTEEVRRDGENAYVKLSAPVELIFPGPWMGVNQGFDWRLGLSAEVDMKLVLKVGASENIVDLTGMRVKEMRLETGASSTVITLPENAGQTRVEVDAGAASVELRVPAGVAAKIRAQTGMADVNVDPNRFPRSGEYYLSPDFETAANRVEIQVKAGVGSIKIR